jgi:signal transduction histidine kinase
MASVEDENYMRSGFLERLAHEIRGPLGVTLLALDEIEQSLEGGMEKLRSKLAIARRGAGRVIRLADRLERAAQLERGATFEMTKTDLRAVVEGATRGTEAVEPRRHVRVVLSKGQEACIASVDGDWMTSAVGEIVGNAIRFAQTTVSVDVRAAEGEARITVSDDGPGFSVPPPLRRFEPPESRSGLGLSLAMVHEVLGRHHGRLEISTPKGGSGCQVTLGLPLVVGELPC